MPAPNDPGPDVSGQLPLFGARPCRHDSIELHAAFAILEVQHHNLLCALMQRMLVVQAMAGYVRLVGLGQGPSRGS